MMAEAHRIHAEKVAEFAQEPSVSIAIDAGTMARRHFLDIMLLAPHTDTKPLLFRAVEDESFTLKKYGDIVAVAISDLHDLHVNVRSIVGDNLPTQVAALAHWSGNSRLRQADDPFLHGIKYSPCMCHFLQLAVGDFLKTADGEVLEAALQSLIRIANFTEVHRVVKSRCPRSVPTRWLSRFDAINWLLSRQSQLMRIDPAGWEDRERQGLFEDWVRAEPFQQVQILQRLLYPFNEATKFFEREDVTLCHVYPAL
jgi:hypothetical protein